MTQGTDGTMGGFRIVRRIGEGSRASVYIGAGATGVVAIKLFRPDVGLDDVGRELDALGRLDSPHLVRLLDLANGDGEAPVLILERIQRGSIASLLRDRDSIERGEVVTLLAPIAETLPALHRLGVAHGHIGASSVHIGASGEPVLLGFGHTELFARGGSIAAMDAEPAAARDREALSSLAVALLSRVRDAAMDRPTLDLIEWIDGTPREFEFSERLVARLFEYAEPTPVEFGTARASVDRALPGRVGVAEPVRTYAPGSMSASPLEPRRSGGAGMPAGMPAGLRDGLLDWLGSVLAHNPLDLARRRVMQFVAGVRKPFWAIAAAVVVALVLAVALLPQNGAAPTAAMSSSARSSSAPTPDSPLPTSAATALPDDPVQALAILLAERNRCVRSRSVLCLDGIDEASSSAYNDDAELIEELQGGSEIPKTAYVTAAAPTLVQLIGDSAILDLGPAKSAATSNPASVLMVRDEAGWRIRGYLTGVPSTGTPSQPG